MSTKTRRKCPHGCGAELTDSKRLPYERNLASHARSCPATTTKEKHDD